MRKSIKILTLSSLLLLGFVGCNNANIFKSYTSTLNTSLNETSNYIFSSNNSSDILSSLGEVNSTNNQGSNLSFTSNSNDVVTEPKNLEIHSLEMKKRYGDSTLIKYGDYDILVDGGESGDDSQVKNALTKYVTDKTLDLLIVSHPHSDHVGGIKRLDTFNSIEMITTVVDTGYNYGDRVEFKTNVLDYFVSKGTNYYPIADVMKNESLASFKIDDDVTFNFLNSEFYEKALITSNINNTSIAFYIKFQNVILFMSGDAESSAEKSFMAMNDKFTSSDNIVIYKAAHHGSNGSNTADFLDYIEPDYCFISAALTIEDGASPNLGQHPYYDAVNRIAKHTKEIYWNGINGNLNIITDGYSVDISGEGRTKNYSYYDKSTNTSSLVDVKSEKDISYLYSKWYQVGIENKGWKDYR